MNIQIVKNKYLNSLFVLMLFSAIIHVSILIFSVLKTGDMYLINFFSIVGVDILIPNFLNSLLGNILSIVFTIALYLLIIKINKTDKN